MTAAFWSELQIAPTADVDQIRRAYARRLKTIDVDTDPQAFITLRESLAAALRAALHPPEGLSPPEEAPQVVADASEETAAQPPIHDRPLDQPPSDETGGQGDDAPDVARFLALERMLFGPDVPAPDDLIAATRSILDHPEMERIDHEDRVEGWLAGALYDSIPRSDPVIQFVADHFQWAARAEQWHQPPILDALLDRAIVVQNVVGLADPGHRYHRAYLDLISTKPTLGLARFTRDREVALLLSAIRRECPAMEGALNPERVALWDKAAGGRIEPRDVSSQPWLVLGLVVLPLLFVWFLFFRPGYQWASRIGALVWIAVLAYFLVIGPPPTNQAGGNGPYTTVEADLNPLLRSVTGYDLDQLSRQNVRLGADLAERWDQARRAGQSRTGFGEGVLRLLDDFARNAIRGGSEELREAHWRLRAMELSYLQGDSAEACDRNANGLDRGQHPTMPEDIVTGRRAVVQRALLENVAPTPPVGGLDYEVEDSIMRTGATRSGLTPERFRTALGGGGDPASRCAARLGFIDAVLELPPARRSAMLRNMSAGL